MNRNIITALYLRWFLLIFPWTFKGALYWMACKQFFINSCPIVLSESTAPSPYLWKMQTLLCWLCFSLYLFRQYKIAVWSWTWCDKTWINSQSVRRSIEVGYLSKRKLKVIVTWNKWGNLLSLSQLDLSSGSFFLSFQAGQMKGICTVRDNLQLKDIYHSLFHSWFEIKL